MVYTRGRLAEQAGVTATWTEVAIVRGANHVDLRLLLVVMAGLGCEDHRPTPPREAPQPAAAPATRFDPAGAGSVRGFVRWQGQAPVVAPFRILPAPGGNEVLARPQLRQNPNAPIIDSQTGGIGNAVVFLRGVDPRRSKPWEYSPVCVEQRGCQFHVRQGSTDSAVGFIRRGESVEMVSRDAWFHSLHAGGAGFFSLAFPDADAPLTRRLSEPGLIELTSGAGYYWMRAYLFVDDHPYFARAAASGRFVLTGVPPGDIEIVCWLPNWLEERHERDPESGLVSRLFFKAPIERVQRLRLGSQESREANFTLSADSARGRDRAASSR
jgi:hypothetical protein